MTKHTGTVCLAIFTKRTFVNLAIIVRHTVSVCLPKIAKLKNGLENSYFLHFLQTALSIFEIILTESNFFSYLNDLCECTQI